MENGAYWIVKKKLQFLATALKRLSIKPKPPFSARRRGNRMETKQSAGELLKEARAELAKAHDHLMELTAKLPMQYFGLVDGDMIQSEDCAIAKIDAYLAAPSESAMEMVRKIREEGEYNDSHGKKEPANTFALLDTEAAALIEGLQRRVPSALFDEIIEIQPLSYAKLGRAFAKHGVKVEG